MMFIYLNIKSFSLIEKIELEETNNLPNTIRGEYGFGSTGK